MTNELSALCENINEKQHIIISMEKENDKMWEDMLNRIMDETGFRNSVVSHDGREGVLRITYGYWDDTKRSIYFYPLKKDGTASKKIDYRYPHVYCHSNPALDVNELQGFIDAYTIVRPYEGDK